MPDPTPQDQERAQAVVGTCGCKDRSCITCRVATALAEQREWDGNALAVLRRYFAARDKYIEVYNRAGLMGAQAGHEQELHEAEQAARVAIREGGG